MQSRLMILHRKKPMVFSPEELGGDWAIWATCLRSLALSFAPEGSVRQSHTPKHTEFYQGQEAYQFLLEIICGLHSPILGETEVFGQFKAFTEGWMKNEPLSRNLVQSLFADAKKVRQLHLSGLGSQSYGSWVRKCLSDKRPVHIVGSGQLVKDVLPWVLKTEAAVHVYCRDYGKALLSLEPHADRIRFHEYAQGPFAALEGALIVCAPIPAEELKEKFQFSKNLLVIDLRDNSHFDLLVKEGDPQSLFKLRDVFKELEFSRSAVIEKAAQAKALIESLSQGRFLGSQVRPFGWDDLCT
jgi:glutamyl-tRNA reductase